MPKIALYTATIVFAAIAVLLAALYVFDTDVIFGRTLFRPLNVLAAAIFFTLFAGWMSIASLEFRGAELVVSKKQGA